MHRCSVVTALHVRIDHVEHEPGEDDRGYICCCRGSEHYVPLGKAPAAYAAMVLSARLEGGSSGGSEKLWSWGCGSKEVGGRRCPQWWWMRCFGKSLTFSPMGCSAACCSWECLWILAALHHWLLDNQTMLGRWSPDSSFRCLQ